MVSENAVDRFWNASNGHVTPKMQLTFVHEMPQVAYTESEGAPLESSGVSTVLLYTYMGRDVSDTLMHL